MVDFRAIGESLDMEIIDMWKYENLLPWIVRDQHVVTNEMHEQLHYRHANSIHIAKRAEKANISVYERMANMDVPAGIDQLWSAISHPAADRLCEQKGWLNNYSHQDFLRRNDKIMQKKLLADQTPAWRIVNSAEVQKIMENTEHKRGFFKRQFGSGGFTIFRSDEVKNGTNVLTMMQEEGSQWFFEEFAEGRPCSIQCVRMRDGSVVVFGFSEQAIAGGKHYQGSNMKVLEDFPKDAAQQLENALRNFEPLLQDYEGFFGIDFILDTSKVWILEANVRMTAATVPTLLANEKQRDHCIYREDAELREAGADDVILALHPDGEHCDVLRCPSSQ